MRQAAARTLVKRPTAGSVAVLCGVLRKSAFRNFRSQFYARERARNAWRERAGAGALL